MERIDKIKIDNTVYGLTHEGVLKNSGFEVVSSLPTTNLFEGREVVYQGKKYMYSSGWKEITGGGNTTLGDLSEDKLLWGKNSLFGALSPIDALIRDNDGYNILSFIDPDAVSIEYSRDGGNSWFDYGLLPQQKNNFFMRSEQVFCGKSKEDGLIASPQFLLRITIDTLSGRISSDVVKTILWCSSSGKDNWCTISSLTNTNYNAGNLSDDFFVTKYNKIPIGGVIGWNTLNFKSPLIFSATQKTDRLLRYTFGCDNVSSGFGLRLDRLIVYAYNIRISSSNMSKYGHLYDYDYLQNAIFPAKVESKEVVNFDVRNIEPTQTGNVTKTSTWLWQYIVQAVNWLKANKVSESVYNAKVAELSSGIDEVTNELVNLTEVVQITSLSNLSWFKERVSEYEIDNNTTFELLDGKVSIAAQLLQCSANQLTLNLYPIPYGRYSKGALDAVIGDLHTNNFAVFTANDLDTIIASGNDFCVRIKISKVPTYKAIIECYVAR